MSQQGGAKPPEFMSTHPSDDRRIKEIEEALVEMEIKGQIKTK
jgi:predicted Zn-dependent protease